MCFQLLLSRVPDDAMGMDSDDSVVEVTPEPIKKVVRLIKEGYKVYDVLLTPSQTQSQNTVFSCLNLSEPREEAEENRSTWQDCKHVVERFCKFAKRAKIGNTCTNNHTRS